MEAAGVSFNDASPARAVFLFPLCGAGAVAGIRHGGCGDLSVTGGMTFGGGPLNNFVFQATVRMAQLLRQNPAEVGLVTTVSGMLTKQACALWSAAQPGRLGFADVTEQVRQASDIRELVASYSGEATVAGYTVLYQGS